MSQLSRHVNWAGSSPAGRAWCQLESNETMPAGDFTPTNRTGTSYGSGSRATGSDPSHPDQILKEYGSIRRTFTNLIF